MRAFLIPLVFLAASSCFVPVVASPATDIQRTLALQGYNVGAIDGIIGKNTISKLKMFCSSNDLDCQTFIVDKNYAGILELIASVEGAIVASLPTAAQRRKSGELAFDNSNGAWFDRSLEVRGIEIVVAGAVGGQPAVPNEWAEKIAQTIKLLTNPNAKNIVRKSIIAKCVIKKGERFTEDNLTVKRPGTGISPMKWDKVIGTVAITDYQVDEPI